MQHSNCLFIVKVYVMNYETYYDGLGKEYYIASEFWKMGYEASKLAVDYGFDLMVTNSIKKNEEPVQYRIQVKSRNINNISMKLSGAGEREEGTRITFAVENRYYEQLKDEKNNAIFIGCLYKKLSEISSEFLCSFWFPGKAFYALEEDNIIYDGKARFFNKKCFDILYRSEASMTTRFMELLERYDNIAQESGEISELAKCNGILREYIQKSTIINNNSNKYIGFYRQEEDKQFILNKRYLSLESINAFNDIKDNYIFGK